MSGLDDSLSDVGAKKKYPFELEKAIHNVMFIQHHMQRQDEFNAVSGTKHGIQFHVFLALCVYVGISIAKCGGIYFMVIYATAFYDKSVCEIFHFISFSKPALNYFSYLTRNGHAIISDLRRRFRLNTTTSNKCVTSFQVNWNISDKIEIVLKKNKAANGWGEGEQSYFHLACKNVMKTTINFNFLVHLIRIVVLSDAGNSLAFENKFSFIPIFIVAAFCGGAEAFMCFFTPIWLMFFFQQ